MNAHRPRILLTTASRSMHEGLRRNDSYTGRNYSEAVLAAGGIPLMAPSVEPEHAAAFLDGVQGVLFTGGVDVDPIHFGQEPQAGLGQVDVQRDLFELALYAAARGRGLPVLGVCRGIQLINIAEGGTLHQHLAANITSQDHSQHDSGGEPYHTIELEPGSRLAAAYGAERIRANSYHHQGLAELGNGLRPSGRAADGLVEAVEGTRGPFLVAVQWHPEMSFARHPEHLAPFAALVEAARAGSAVAA